MGTKARKKKPPDLLTLESIQGISPLLIKEFSLLTPISFCNGYCVSFSLASSRTTQFGICSNQILNNPFSWGLLCYDLCTSIKNYYQIQPTHFEFLGYTCSVQSFMRFDVHLEDSTVNSNQFLFRIGEISYLLGRSYSRREVQNWYLRDGFNCNGFIRDSQVSLQVFSLALSFFYLGVWDSVGHLAFINWCIHALVGISVLSIISVKCMYLIYEKYTLFWYFVAGFPISTTIGSSVFNGWLLIALVHIDSLLDCLCSHRCNHEIRSSKLDLSCWLLLGNLEIYCPCPTPCQLHALYNIQFWDCVCTFCWLIPIAIMSLIAASIVCSMLIWHVSIFRRSSGLVLYVFALPCKENIMAMTLFLLASLMLSLHSAPLWYFYKKCFIDMTLIASFCWTYGVVLVLGSVNFIAALHCRLPYIVDLYCFVLRLVVGTLRAMNIELTDQSHDNLWLSALILLGFRNIIAKSLQIAVLYGVQSINIVFTKEFVVDLYIAILCIHKWFIGLTLISIENNVFAFMERMDYPVFHFDLLFMRLGLIFWGGCLRSVVWECYGGLTVALAIFKHISVICSNWKLGKGHSWSWYCTWNWVSTSPCITCLHLNGRWSQLFSPLWLLLFSALVRVEFSWKSSSVVDLLRTCLVFVLLFLYWLYAMVASFLYCLCRCLGLVVQASRGGDKYNSDRLGFLFGATGLFDSHGFGAFSSNQNVIQLCGYNF